MEEPEPEPEAVTITEGVAVDCEEKAWNGLTEQTAEQLVARAIAPVKPQYLCPPPPRTLSTPHNNQQHNNDNNDKKDSLVKEKKSKRQLKRERRQVLPSFLPSSIYNVHSHVMQILTQHIYIHTISISIKKTFF